MNTVVRPPEIAPTPFRMSVEFLRALDGAGLLQDDDARHELVDGELQMVPPPGSEHQATEKRLLKTLFAAMAQSGQMEAFDVQTGGGFATGPFTLLAPDVMLVRAFPEARAYTSDDVIVLVEISWSSLDRDLKLKAEHYADAGVQEYWVLDVPARAVIVHRDPREGRYASIETREEPAMLTPKRAPELVLSVKDFF